MIGSTMPAWLQQNVPLWALLIAMLTNPAMWSRLATSAVTERLGITQPDQTEATDER